MQNQSILIITLICQLRVGDVVVLSRLNVLHIWHSPKGSSLGLETRAGINPYRTKNNAFAYIGVQFPIKTTWNLV